jgi:isopenicillin N synthase-like dioxygenase
MQLDQTPAMASSPQAAGGRAALLKAFDESRTGVRGLVESGVSSVPEIFRHPDPYASIPLAPPGVSIPVVDLSLPFPDAAAAATEAARTWGFFHLINYEPKDGGGGYPARALAAVRAFNELPAAERAAHYSRPVDGGVNYFTNIDLYTSSAASWRDSIQITLGPSQYRLPDLAARIPAVCSAELLEWEARATAAAREVMGLLSEGLGLGAAALEEASCLEGRVMACHYYPHCPEPERTMGVVPHTDPIVLTVLVQDEIGGLQVKHQDQDGKSCWVDVKPVPGALVINVGDLLQVQSSCVQIRVVLRVILMSRTWELLAQRWELLAQRRTIGHIHNRCIEALQPYVGSWKGKISTATSANAAHKMCNTGQLR